MPNSQYKPTEQELLDFKKEVMITYASVSGKGRAKKLQFDAEGNFFVNIYHSSDEGWKSQNVYSGKSASKAIKEYNLLP